MNMKNLLELMEQQLRRGKERWMKILKIQGKKDVLS